jgi:signal transduction histidine kinase
MKIADKGVGIADEDVQKAFDKFNRIENPLSRQEGGSGLGLFLANQLAKGHGGHIRVEKKKGRSKGTTFVLTLPAVAMIDHEIVSLAHQKKRGRRQRS